MTFTEVFQNMAHSTLALSASQLTILQSISMLITGLNCIKFTWTSSLHLRACSRSTWLFSTKTEWCYSAVTHLQTPQIRKLYSTLPCPHHCDVLMGAIASQITSLTIVYSTVHSGPHQRKHQSSAPLAFVRGIHRRPVNSPRKWKMFQFDDVIMYKVLLWCCYFSAVCCPGYVY